MIKEYAEFEKNRRNKSSDIKKSYAEFIRNNPEAETKSIFDDENQTKTTNVQNGVDSVESVIERVLNAQKQASEIFRVDRDDSKFNSSVQNGNNPNQNTNPWESPPSLRESVQSPTGYNRYTPTTSGVGYNPETKELVSLSYNPETGEYTHGPYQPKTPYKPEPVDMHNDLLDVENNASARNFRDQVYEQTINSMASVNQAHYEYNELDEETMADVQIMADGLIAEDNMTGFSGLFNRGTSTGDAFNHQITEAKYARGRLLDKGYSPEQVDTWANLRKQDINQEFNENMYEEIESMNPVAASLMSVPYNIISTPVNAILQAEGAITRDYDPYSPTNSVLQAGDIMQANVAEDITENYGEFWGDVYNAGMSMANSYALSFVPGGAAMMAVDAGTGAYLDALDKGVDEKHAFVDGLIVGTINYLAERYSIGSMKKMRSVPLKGWRSLAGNLAKSFSVNYQEEGVTEAATILYDIFSHGDESDFMRSYNQYIDNGEDSNKAFLNAFVDMGKQVGEAGFWGGVSGVGFGLSDSGISYIRNYNPTKSAGTQAMDSGSVDAILDSAKLAPKGTGPYQALDYVTKKQNKGKTLTEHDIGHVAVVMQDYIRENTPELNGVFESAKTLEDIEALYNTERYRIQNSPLTPQETKSAIKALDADYKVAKTSLENFNTSGARAMLDGSLRNKTYSEADIVKTRKPTIGKTAAGEFVSVSSVDSIKDGAIFVKTSEGTTQELDTQALTGKAKDLWSYAAENFDNVDAVQAFVDGYDGGSIDTYSRLFKSTYRLAATGMTANDIVKENVFDVNALGQKAFNQAVETGTKLANNKVGVLDVSTVIKTNAQKLTVNMMDNFGKRHGLNIVVVDSLNGKEGKYKPSANQIVVALDASGGALNRVFGHETYHYLKHKNPMQAEKISNFVFDTMTRLKGKEWVDDFIDKTYDKETYKTDEARREEFVADQMFEVFANERAVKEFVNKDVSLARKFVNHVKSLISEIKGILKKLVASGRYEDIAAWQEDLDSLQKLNDMMLDALANVEQKSQLSERNTAEAVSYSTIRKQDVQAAQSIGRKSINSLTSAELNKLSAFAEKYWNELGAKSPFFRAWFGDWRTNDITPIVVADKKGKTGPTALNADTGWEINIPGKAKNETTRHKSNKARFAVPYLDYLEDIAKNAVLLESFGSDKGGDSLLMHSFYAVADIGNGAEALKLYVEELNNVNSDNTTKRTYMLQNITKQSGSPGSQNNSVSRVTPTAIKTVADLFTFVKQNDKNFTPNPASKIVNPDGTPKVMYHGTQSSFTAFDKKKAKSYGYYGKGFYFTESESHSKQYGNSMAVYLDVKNPLEPGKNKLTKNQLRTFLEAVAENEDYDIWNYGTEDISEIIESIYKNDAFAVIQDINATAIGNFAEALELFNDVNGTNYDGIVTPTETVVYEPTQIKSVDNIGTFDKSNDDIRYSKKRVPNLDPNKPRTPGKRLIESPLTDSSKINYNYEEHDPLSFDDRAKPNSKSSINWVYKAEIFSTVENKMFHQKLAEIKQGSDAFVQTEDGEYIIPIENKLVFTNGDFDTPYIREIFEVITEYSTNFEKVKDVIVDEARGRTGHREAVQLIKQVFGDGLVLQYKSNADGVYGWADRKPKGRNRRAAINNYINQQFRKRNAGKSKANQSITPSFNQDTDIAPDNTQVKSADPVTHDDNGNVIPLSKRFNEAEEDIRYSRKRYWYPDMSNSDLDYVKRLAKNELPKTEKHIDNITKWLYNDKNGKRYFAIYSTEDKTDPTILYASKDNQAIADYDFLKYYNDLVEKMDGESDDRRTETIDEIFSFYQSAVGLHSTHSGYDVGGKYNSETLRVHNEKSKRRLYGALRSCLQDCFDRRNAQRLFDDVNEKHSTKRDTSISEEASNYILDTKEYQEVLDVLEKRFDTLGKVKLSPKAIDRLAGRLLEKSKSNYSREQLTERLTALFDFIVNSREVSWEEITTIAANISKDMLKESRTLDRSMQTEYADVLKLMRETKVYISPELKAEIAYNFGSYDAFRRLLGNKLKVTVTDTSAVPLDVFWRELAENRPEMFDEATNLLDMPSRLAEFFEMTSPQYINPYDNVEMDMDEAAYDFALQMYDEYFNIPEVKTEAQKYAFKEERLRGKYNAQIKEIRNTYRERIKNIRKEKNNKIEATKELYRQKHEAYRTKRNETQAKQKLRSQIYRTAKGLVDKLVNPTDQKHIPQELISSVTDFCKTITDSGVFALDKTLKLQDAFKRISESASDPDANLSTMYNEEIGDMLEDLRKTISGRRMTELNSAELAQVKEAARYFAHVVSMSNKAFSDNIKERLSDLQTDVLDEFTKVNPDRKRIKTEMQKGLLKPVTFFELLESPTLMKLYQNIRNGEGKWYNTVAAAKEYRLNTAAENNYKSWKNDKITLRPERFDGDVVLSVDEALSIYATAKREQGVDHLLMGGIVREEDAKKKLNRKEKSKSVDVRAENIPLTMADVSNISEKLTKEQKAYADSLIKYLSNDMASLGNEVSMKLFGIKKYNEKSYFPLKSASNFLYSKPAVENDARIKHMSMTKRTVPKANNPVIIGNFTETVMNHCNDMALYYSFCLPLEDFNRVYNFKTQPTMFERPTSIKQKIDRAFGAKANGYIKQLLTDINGGVTQQAGAGVVNKMISLAKKNAVFGSLSVAVQQPSAVARAFLYVDPKYFVQSTFSKRDWNELKTYAPVAGVKEMGYFDTNIGRQAVDWMTEDKYEGLKEKAFALFKDGDYRDGVLSFLPAYMDQISWGHIWNAVKKETAHNNPDMDKHSEEFLKLAGERFTYVIDRTQVYDSVFARSEWMRSKDTGVKVATAFMSEPLTNYNMLYSAAVKARHGNKKFALKAASAYIVSVAFNSVLKSLVTAGRDDDEDKSYWEKYLSDVVANFIDEPFGMIPYLKDFISLMQGYDSSRMDTQVLADLVKTVQTVSDSDKTPYEKVKSVFGTFGIALGVPFKNLWRDSEMVVRTVEKIFKGEFEPTTEQGIINAIKENIDMNTPSAYEQVVDAYLNSDDKHYNKVYDNLIDSKSEKAIESGIESVAKDKFQSGEITEVEATRILTEILELSDNETYWLIDKWSETANGEDYAKYNNFAEAVRTGKDLKNVIDEYLDHGVEKKTLAGQITKTFKSEYVELCNTDRAEASVLRRRILDAYVALGYDRDDKSDDIADWLEN